MFTAKILPIVIITCIIQLLILTWCIKKVYTSSGMMKWKKIIWIFVLVLFPAIGIIVYLIVTRNKSIDKNIKDFGNGFDENIQNSIFFSLFYTFVFLMFAIVYSNPDNLWIAALLSVSTILMLIIHFYRDSMNNTLRCILPYLLVTIVTLVEFITVTQDYKIIILVAVAAIIIEYPLNFSKVFFAVPLILFQTGALIKLYILGEHISSDYILNFLFKNTITYMMIIAAFYFAKRQLIMNNYLQYLMKELKNKSQELEDAGIMKERNRIAREIHDTLGHTLTGAIIQLEVAKQLVNAAPEKVKSSIQKTQDITRDGLKDVKRAIKALRPIMIDENTLYDGLQLFFEHMKRDCDYCVDDEIMLPDNISDDLKISVYRVIQELITNSMRHGEANNMKVIIDNQFDTLRIHCCDNGCGCSSITEGNGLTGIRERVEKLGGSVDFSSQAQQGFETIIYIPL